MSKIPVAALAVIFLAGFAASFAQDAEIVETTTVREETDHEVIHANTLWDLAEHYYKNPWMWPTIYAANRDSIKDPHWIYPNQVLIIPGLGKSVTVVKTTPVRRPKPEKELPPPAKPPMVEIPVPKPAPERPKGVELPEGLSIELPRGMTGSTTSNPRLKMPDDWRPDGEVMENQGRESMAAAGDRVRVSIEGTGRVRRRQKYIVYRWSGPTENDEDRTGNFVVRIGRIEVVRNLGHREYMAEIVESGGSVQLGDIIQLE